MAQKDYYIKDNEINNNSSAFTKKMREAGYYPIRMMALAGHHQLYIYDINTVGVLFHQEDARVVKESSIGNIIMAGREGDIIKVRKRIEQRTGFKLEEVKQ